MSGANLYKGLIEATEEIVAKFGKDVLKEERFVNILADMYPDRDNPAVFKIIKTAIQDGSLNNVLNSNYNSIERLVATTTNKLFKQYGYNLLLVGDILYSLAIGYGTISMAQFNTIISSQNKPSTNNIPPHTKNHYPNPNQKKPYSKNQKPNNNPPKNNTIIDKISVKQNLIFLLAIIGIIISPAIYATTLCVANFQPSVASFYVALWQLFTITPISLFLFPDSNRPINQNLLGGYVSLHFIAIVFWIFFPFFFGFEDVQYYFGFIQNDNGFPLGAIILNIFCAYFMYARIVETLNLLSVSNLNGNKTISSQLIYCFKLDPFRKGFKIIFIIFISLGFLMLIYPLISNNTSRHIENFDIERETINKQKDELKSKRSKLTLELSFAQYEIGDSFSSCVDKIPDNEEYQVDRVYNSLSIDNIDYDSMIDSVLRIKSKWNNEDVEIGLYFNSSKVFAISFDVRFTPADTIIALYSSKYGEPEYHLETYYEKFGFSENKSEFYKTYTKTHRDYVPEIGESPKDYFWTYKNSFINVNCSDFRFYTTITYFDRKIEKKQKDKIQEQRKIEEAAEKHQTDSLNRVQEENERLERERIRREMQEREMNHKKSIEQI